MIKTSELRIGVTININGSPCSIGYDMLGDIAQKLKGIKNSYLDKLEFSAIPLTPEILEKVWVRMYT